jgi:pyruvate formate lyase activating enzyme
MAVCGLCGTDSRVVSARMGYCGPCLADQYDRIRTDIEQVHIQSRAAFGLPLSVPVHAKGLACDRCVNQCRIPPGETGFCGLRKNRDSRLIGGDAESGRVSWYHDPLPTNCVADPVCPGGTGSGHPVYAHVKGPEHGWNNLAVFYEACAFNCLYCQNWSFKRKTKQPGEIKSSRLAEAVRHDTSCICYFGGDPGPQAVHALETARMAREANPDRILRICWETNGSASPPVIRRMVETSLESGGIVKFDLKAFSSGLHKAMCGVDNRQTLENFTMAADLTRERYDPPALMAATLMVPGYVDADEVGRIADFIARLNPNIPYALLAFYPSFHLNDLPCTSAAQAQRCLDAAESHGLTRVWIGNRHLLDRLY